MLGNIRMKSWAIAAGVAIMAASSAAATSAGSGAAAPAAASHPTTNPYSPAYGHAYRHGVFPTREAHARMKQYQALQATTAAATGTETLSYGGGVDGIGVTSGTPKVYLVVYGSQWGTASTNGSGNMTLSGDAYGAVPYLENLFKGLGTGGELWSGVMTQYCDGSSVTTGATFCPVAPRPSAIRPAAPSPASDTTIRWLRRPMPPAPSSRRKRSRPRSISATPRRLPTATRST